MLPVAALLLALATAMAGCGSSVTGFRSRQPLPEFDLVGVESTARVVSDTDRLVVLATGQHTALDADFDLFLAMVVPNVAQGVGAPLRAEDRVRILVIRNSPDVRAFIVQSFNVTQGDVRWESGRPVVRLKAVSESQLPASLKQVPPWHGVETTLRCDPEPQAFRRMSDRFCTQSLLDQRPRGPLEQMVRVLRKLDEAADDIESALDDL